jgi:hypothetical protein
MFAIKNVLLRWTGPVDAYFCCKNCQTFSLVSMVQYLLCILRIYSLVGLSADVVAY